MDITVPPGSGAFNLTAQTAAFPAADGVRAPQRFAVALVERAFELTYGYRNLGSPGRPTTTYRLDLTLQGWLR